MNNGCTYTETVAQAGLALSAYLAARHRHTAEPQWRRRIEEGRVLVDGRAARAEQPVERGQVVSWSRPGWEEPEAPLDYGVLFEDDELLAVSKPCGLPTLPGAGYLENTLLFVVRRRYPEASPVHRLGRGTSGVVLFARGREAARSLERAWRERRVRKIYRALAEGWPESDSFVVEAPIGPVPHPCLGTVHAASVSGKPALSRVRVLERREGAALVEVSIDTGRPHQVRIHMAASGHPLAGDPLYAAGGLPKPGGLARPGDLGYLLHALRLEAPHPRTGTLLAVECPAPAALSLAGARSAPPAGR